MPNTKMKTFLRNYIDQDVTGFTLSGDFAPTANVSDRLKTTYAITTGHSTDSVAQVYLVTITSVVNGNLYRVIINGVNCDYTSDANATHTEIIEGLYAAVAASGEPVTPSYTNADHEVANLHITANYSGDAFTASVSGGGGLYGSESVANVDGKVEFVADMTSERSINAIMIKSNLKDFDLWQWTGSAYVLVKQYTANTSEFILYEFTAIASSKIKIIGRTTITAAQEKKIYLLEITKSIGEIQIPKPDIKQVMETADFKNLYGGSVKIVKYYNYPKVKINISPKNITGTDYTTYALLKAKAKLDAYIVYLYFSDTYALLGEEAWYLVNDLADYEETPSEQHLYAGIDGKLELAEC